MLYKNKIKVQNILKSAVAFVFMLTLSLSTALSPLAKAEEARWTWKTLTSMPVSNPSDFGGIYVSPDGSKLFIFERDSPHNITSLWMSADDGTTWRKIFSKPGTVLGSPSYTVDGSKIVLSHMNSFHISTDGGQNWTEKWSGPASVSPDGSFLAGCSISGGAYTTYISTDDGHNWTQKGTNSVECPTYVTNNGTLIAKAANKIAKSTDYGQTWTEISGFSGSLLTSFGNNGNTIFDGGNRISLDGGNHWTPSNAPIPAGYTIYGTGISDDGKKLFIDLENPSGAAREGAFLMSVDGGRTWSTENTSNEPYWSVMSSNGSKLLRLHRDSANNVIYRVGTLTAAQPVTPGSGAGGAVAPSTGSTSATPGQKPGKASGRLAETGTSTWTVGGLAVVAVAAGALVLRKRL